MIPAVLIAEERDPLAVRCPPGLRSRLTPIGNTPEFLFVDFMNGFDRTGRGIGNVNEIFLEVLRFSIENQALRVYPGQSSIFAGRMDRHGFSSVELQRVHLP